MLFIFFAYFLKTWKLEYSNYNFVFIFKKMDRILVHRRRYSNIFDVQSYRAADCDIDHNLVVVKVWERLAVNKQRSYRFHMERLNLKKLNEVWGRAHTRKRSRWPCKVQLLFQTEWRVRRDTHTRTECLPWPCEVQSWLRTDWRARPDTCTCALNVCVSLETTLGL
jgi:hypothetical protein